MHSQKKDDVANFRTINLKQTHDKSRTSEIFLGKSVLRIYNKFIGEHPCQSMISKKLLWNFIEVALRHGCSPVIFLHIFITPFYKNTSEGLLLS